MYYTIENTIGTEVNVNGMIYVCGQCYATKTKAPKDANYILAFSKAENPVDGLIWRFDGKAELDYHAFQTEAIDNLQMLFDRAWKQTQIEGRKLFPFDEFVEDVIADLDYLFVMAWKAEKITIQAKIRPSKDSKKAIAQAARVDKFAQLNQELLDGIITVEQFAEKTRLIVSQM